MRENIGEFMVRVDAMNQCQVIIVLRAQKAGYQQRFGDIARVFGTSTTGPSRDTWRRRQFGITRSSRDRGGIVKKGKKILRYLAILAIIFLASCECLPPQPDGRTI